MLISQLYENVMLEGNASFCCKLEKWLKKTDLLDLVEDTALGGLVAQLVLAFPLPRLHLLVHLLKGGAVPARLHKYWLIRLKFGGCIAAGFTAFYRSLILATEGDACCHGCTCYFRNEL